MLDLTLIIIFKLLLWISLTIAIISGILLTSLFIITSDATKLPEYTVEMFLKLSLILVVSIGIYVTLPSSNFLSKIENGLKYKLTQEYKLPTKDKK